MPRIGWVDLTPDEAMEMGCEQVARFRWQMFRIEWLGVGISLMVRAI